MVDQLPLALPAPQGRRRGRPPGSKSKASLDLARYIEARFSGQTPGQQAAELCMVTQADMKKAPALAAQLTIANQGLSPLMLAMVVKADQLAAALGIKRAEAWVLLQREREGLMPYVHQKRAPQADQPGEAAPATVYLVHDEDARPVMSPPMALSTDFVDDFETPDP